MPRTPRPKQIEVFQVKTRRPRFNGGEWQFRGRARNGQTIAPHSETSHTRTWTRTLAKREAEKFDPPIPVVTV